MTEHPVRLPVRAVPTPRHVILRDLPPGLASRLPPTKFGQRRYIVGNDVVLIEAATGLILDILEGVFGIN